MINCIIIDDQAEAIEVLSTHINTKPELNLVDSFNNPLLALRYLEQNAIDLVFLDIQMPQLTGIEFIESLRLKRSLYFPHFIFVSGFANYAIDGFEHGVVDFLLKPVIFKRFNIAVDRYLAQFQNKEMEQQVNNDFLFVDNEGQKVKINFADIVYIESAGNYISIFKKEERLTVLHSLSSMLAILDTARFIKVHKSYIINIDAITAVRGGNLLAQYKSKSVSIPMSATYKDIVLKRLKIKF